MSVLIKGAEMPKTCEECQSTLGLFAKECPLFAEFPKEFDYDPEIGNNRRYANCPLVEVLEPHGRLIDADPIIVNRSDYYTSDDFMEAVNMLEDASTIIEAEK